GRSPRPLPALEFRDPLLLVRRDSFFRVVALKEELLQLALDRERRLEREVPTRLHRSFDPADRLRRLVRRDELAGVVHDLLPPLLRRRVDDLVDETEVVRLFEGERVARDHELDRPRLSDELSETGRAAGG